MVGLAQKVILETVDSTNAEALRRAAAGERGPLWIVARQQTAGRGRRGFAWVSPPGNLFATLLLIDPAPPAAAPQLGFVAGVALHDAVAACDPDAASSQMAERHAVPRTQDRWHPDRRGGPPLAVAVGIGVNCRHHPAITSYPATDFAAEGAAVEASELFERLAAPLRRGLRSGIGVRALPRSAPHGSTAPMASASRPCSPAERETAGTFEAIDGAGRLLLRLKDGSLEAIAAGEVFPAPADAAHNAGSALHGEALPR